MSTRGRLAQYINTDSDHIKEFNTSNWQRQSGSTGGCIDFLLVSQQVNRRNTPPSQVPCLADMQLKPRLGRLSQDLWSHSLYPPELKTPCFHPEMEEASEEVMGEAIWDPFILHKSENLQTENSPAQGNKIGREFRNAVPCISYLATCTSELKQFCMCPFESMRLHACRKHPISQGAMFQKQKKNT